MKLYDTYQTCRHLDLGQHVPEAPGPLDQWQREVCLAVPARVHKLIGRFL